MMMTELRGGKMVRQRERMTSWSWEAILFSHHHIFLIFFVYASAWKQFCLQYVAISLMVTHLAHICFILQTAHTHTHTSLQYPCYEDTCEAHDTQISPMRLWLCHVY